MLTPHERQLLQELTGIEGSLFGDRMYRSAPDHMPIGKRPRWDGSIFIWTINEVNCIFAPASNLLNPEKFWEISGAPLMPDWRQWAPLVTPLMHAAVIL